MTYAPELRSIPLTFLDCPSQEVKQNLLPSKSFDGCMFDKLDLYECCSIRKHHNCPRGFP